MWSTHPLKTVNPTSYTAQDTLDKIHPLSMPTATQNLHHQLHARTHTHTHTLTHACTHTHTNTHTQTHKTHTHTHSCLRYKHIHIITAICTISHVYAVCFLLESADVCSVFCLRSRQNFYICFVVDSTNIKFHSCLMPVL